MNYNFLFSLNYLLYYFLRKCVCVRGSVGGIYISLRCGEERSIPTRVCEAVARLLGGGGEVDAGEARSHNIL